MDRIEGQVDDPLWARILHLLAMLMALGVLMLGAEAMFALLGW